jgi:ubiquinone biosynthesis accessory factor UbiK
MNPPDPSQFFNDLQQKLKELAENSPAKDIEKNMRAFASGVATKMDLVPREEFDALQAQLSAARTKLAELEQRLTALEGKA